MSRTIVVVRPQAALWNSLAAHDWTLPGATPSPMTDDYPRAMVCDPAPHPLRICVVDSRLQFPMTRGNQRTVAHLLSYLHARGHEVDFFTLGTGGKVSAGQRQWPESTCRKLNIFGHEPLTILRGIGSVLTTLFAGN